MTPIKSKGGTYCIGITGGVGAGKSRVISYLSERCSCRVFIADEEAKKLYVPGSVVFDKIIEAAGSDVLSYDGQIDRRALASRIFTDSVILDRINSAVHPAVKEMILQQMEEARKDEGVGFLFIEAALLIEEGYPDILDDIWYVYASESTRRRRLKESRGYTDERIDAMMSSQMRDSGFRKYCRYVIDNDSDIDCMKASVDGILKEYGS